MEDINQYLQENSWENDQNPRKWKPDVSILSHNGMAVNQWYRPKTEGFGGKHVPNLGGIIQDTATFG